MNLVRWPAATVETAEVRVEFLDGASGRWLYQRKERALGIYRGRRPGAVYVAEPHSAAWRSYGEIVAKEIDVEADLAAVNVAAVVDTDRLCNFVRSYGPLGSPDADDEPFGRGALAIALHLRNLADYWDDASRNDGTSRRQPDSVAGRKAEIADLWIQAFLKGSRPPPANTLEEFLLKSASRHLRQEISMRRCVVCANWIELTRTDRLYCDTACRMMRGSGGQRGRRRTRGES